MIFKTSEIEDKKIKKWQKKHLKTCIYYAGESSWTYIITPTGIGDAVVVRCNICGVKNDLTDYDNW